MTYLRGSDDQIFALPNGSKEYFKSHVIHGSQFHDLVMRTSSMVTPYSDQTTKSCFKTATTSDQGISCTETISQDILKDPVKVIYLFQCFQEAQDKMLCEALQSHLKMV